LKSILKGIFKECTLGLLGFFVCGTKLMTEKKLGKILEHLIECRSKNCDQILRNNWKLEMK